MRSSHLLGEEWVGHGFYTTAAERDDYFLYLLIKHPYSRIGYYPSHILNNVVR
jgi:hypothetical protein